MQDKWRGNATALVGDGCGDERIQMAISSYLDGEADPAERAMAEWHLAECRQCQLLLAGWSQDSARLRFATQDRTFDRNLDAITGQARLQLPRQLPELIAPRPVRPHGPVFAPRLALGALVAALTIFVSVLGVGLSGLAGSSNIPLTVAATTSPAQATYAMSIPATATNLAVSSQATPSLGQATLALGYRPALRVSVWPPVNTGLSYPVTQPPTPSVVLSHNSNRD